MRSSETFIGVFAKLGAVSFSLIYLSVSLSIWTWLRHLPDGRDWVILTIVPACLCDTFGLIFGKSFGKRRFAPRVSPNKTWAGFGGALIGSLLGSYLVRSILMPSLSLTDMVAIALGLWIFSPLGDLVESLIKRSLQVKDSGTIIPGHGGMLDRLDSFLFSAPFLHYSLLCLLKETR
jgi:phosphatidate cytidylyltransferase